MAIYHFHVGVVQRSKGYSSVAAAAYQSASILMDERTGILYNYARKRGVWHSEIFLPEAAPGWMQNREQLWNTVEQLEKRKDAQPARMLDIALPVELTEEQNLALMREFVQANFVAAGMVADVSMHYDNIHNPHVHILLSMRCINTQEELGFSCVKERAWNHTSFLVAWRESWAEHVNRYLTFFGHLEQVDHRSYVAQGVATIPTIHLGQVAYYAQKYRGMLLQRAEINQAIEIANADRLLVSQLIAGGLFARRNLEVDGNTTQVARRMEKLSI